MPKEFFFLFPKYFPFTFLCKKQSGLPKFHSNPNIFYFIPTFLLVIKPKSDHFIFSLHLIAKFFACDLPILYSSTFESDQYPPGIESHFITNLLINYSKPCFPLIITHIPSPYFISSLNLLYPFISTFLNPHSNSTIKCAIDSFPFLYCFLKICTFSPKVLKTPLLRLSLLILC